MKAYIGVLSIVYIIFIIVKLKDNQKSFGQYIKEYQQIKQQLELIGQQKDPFFALKLTNAVLYIFLIFYYLANAVFFAEITIIKVISYLLLAVAIYRCVKKMLISSISDLEKSIKLSKNNYKRQRLLNLIFGFLEFAYAFNALSLLSLYY